MIELWGRKNSSNVMTVTWTLGELGLEYQRHNVGGSFGGLDTPEMLARNPNAVVPTLEDDGKTIWESNAISRYLSAKYGSGTLWPTDIFQRAIADQWMDWLNTTMYPGFVPAFINMIRTAPENKNQAAIDAALKTTYKTLTDLDRHLQSNRYVAGDDFTMGDIPLGPAIYRYMNLNIERPPLTALDRWYQLLCERPAYQKHVMIPFGESLDDWNRLEREGANS